MIRHLKMPHSKRLLMSGVSLLMLLAAHPGMAQTVTGLRGTAATGTGTTSTVRVGTDGLTGDQRTALLRQQQNQARAATAVDLAQQAQAAARAATGRNLTGSVLNGLGVGALQPAVSAPTNAADDPTGLLTWQGASMPTQQANAQGGYDVTIVQDQARALLSWDSFNVGRNTTLTFDQGGHSDWIALNRVVGQIDPTTGLRNPALAPAPSQILGAIKGDGTVMVINQNGIVFGAHSQINVHSLIATTLEINGGPSLKGNTSYLSSGLYVGGLINGVENTIFGLGSALTANSTNDPMLEGNITVEAGANIATTGTDGLILMAGPQIDTAGQLTANDGQVVLQSGRNITAIGTTGSANSLDPDVRGLVVYSPSSTGVADYVRNTGIITADRGNITLGASNSGAVIDSGVLASTTSVARNGSIRLSGPDVEVAPNATLVINADTSPDVVPNDASTIAAFKPSDIFIGNGNQIINALTGDYTFEAARIDIGANSLILAPGGNVQVGAATGATGTIDATQGQSQVFVDTGATIDVSGLKDVQVAATRNEIVISPVKGNELADDPNYKGSFLNGATVYVDPRQSGVRDDGTAWIGSPLIDAASYYAQVGVTASELLTKGGNVSLGVNNFTPFGTVTQAANVVVKPGADIDISGGWTHYQAGTIVTSRLVTADGRVVDISQADPNETYIGFAGGQQVDHARWGVVDNFMSVWSSGRQSYGDYTEGHDAGTLSLIGASIAFDGVIQGQAYAGALQSADGETGTGSSSVYGDMRAVQGANSQLPSGGAVLVQAARVQEGTSTGAVMGGADILLTDSDNITPLSAGLGYGYDLSLDANGHLVHQTARTSDSLLSDARQDTISLSSDMLSAAGLSQLTLITTGKVTVDKSADLTLAPGGVFDATAGRTLTVDGSVTAAGGRIYLETSSIDNVFGTNGNIFKPTAVDGDSYDVIVNGTLSVRGNWINDYGATGDAVRGPAWMNGGTIVLSAAADVLSGTPQIQDVTQPGTTAANTVPVDDSGSILVNAGAVLDLTGGGRVDQKGNFNLTAKGGNLVLDDETAYFQLTTTQVAETGPVWGSMTGFRAGGMNYNLPGGGGTHAYLPANPAQINSTVTLAGTVLAQGFGGGGSFSLTTPAFSLGDGTVTTGTELPLDFFSKTGFASYDITSYKTSLTPSTFKGVDSGYDAVLAVQTVTVGAGQTLDLTQSVLPSVLDAATRARLQGLATGGDVLSVVTAGVPQNAWDRKAVDLTLGGSIELHVAQGGQVIGEAGAQLGVSRLDNEGYIRLPGGTISQTEDLPDQLTSGSLPHGVHSLSDAFTYDADGTIDESKPNALGVTDSQGHLLTNGQLAQSYGLYLLGLNDWNQGIRLADGSTTDLSGEVILNPYATDGNGQPIVTGRLIGGGTIETTQTQSVNNLFGKPLGNSSYTSLLKTLGTNQGGTYSAKDAPDLLVVDAGADLDLSGAWGVFDTPVRVTSGLSLTDAYRPTLEWSDGGTLSAANGADISQAATINAHGGAVPAGDPASSLGQTQSQGGTFAITNLVLTQGGETTPPAGAVSANQLMASGFDTLVAWNSVDNHGDVDLTLKRGFFLESQPFAYIVGGPTRATAPVVLSDGGTLSITAPYIRFDGSGTPPLTSAAAATGTGSVSFTAQQIDFAGSTLIDKSIANASFTASGDIRLIGVSAPPLNAAITTDSVFPLVSQIAAGGNLSFTAAQLYATTGSTASITSSGAGSTITFARSTDDLPDTPYSAGSALTVQAAHIVQGGVLRAPLGALTLGGATATGLAAATQDVSLTGGSVTSVSAGGLVIPYGTTTDQTEWFFTPTTTSALTSLPTGVLTLSGGQVNVNSGSTVDLSGGGDVYAYEFVPGTGGSHDVLSRLNSDVFTGNNGLQYADGRQVYAIVPGLANGIAAPYDPIYSADYSALGSAGGVGSRVWLDGGQGVAAGWYTLLPAQYATLPGAYRVVQQTGAKNTTVGTDIVQKDGSMLISGRFGDAASGSSSSQESLFEVDSRAVVLAKSNIQLTSGVQFLTANAAASGTTAPRLSTDAGRLVLAATAGLDLDGTFDTQAAAHGRGAQVDITASNIEISSVMPANTNDGVVHVTAAGLDKLNAESLLIGGVRTDNADGTTSLNVSAQSILVDNDAAHPLSAPEIVLTVDDLATGTRASSITLANGATITATGTLGDTRAGDYLIDARPQGSTASTMTGEGAVVRIANGPERLVTRQTASGAPAQPDADLNVGAVNLGGNAVMLDSTGNLTLSDQAALNTKFLALGAGQTTFADDATGLSGLVITPELRARLTGLAQLTLRAQGAIGFDDGTYDLGGIRLDAAGLMSRQGGQVTLTGSSVVLTNETGVDVTANGGAGTLVLQAGDLTVGAGTLSTQGFGMVDITATGGIYGRGAGGLDLADAAVALHTPFIGDRADSDAAGTVKLTLATTGALTVDKAGAAANFAAPAIATGGSLTLQGDTIAVSGTTLRETAGAVKLIARNGISVGNGATIATPGYDKNFADSADPSTAAAPGGNVSLATAAGDIALGSGTLLSVGGGAGTGGTLSLSAAQGTVSFGGTIEGKGDNGGGSLTVETQGAFDLAGTGAAANAAGFTGGLDFITHSGDLVLNAGQTLKAANVQLTADGGQVNVAGTIDTSGVNGGDVGLYGHTGVTLASTAIIDATASGYGVNDSRQARGGNVTLGVDGTGVLAINNGAVIDVSAEHPGDRLVQLLRGADTDYQYVQGDVGGQVTLRAPVVDNGGGDTVNVSVASASSIKGASSVTLEGFKSWDLAAIAASGAYSGVTYDAATNTITLDAGADLDTANNDGTVTTVGGVNLLGDAGAGTVVDFVQNFDISRAYGNLGGLASQGNFHAAAGVDLAFSGNIALASNWNLGAGIVNVSAAVAAGLMADNGAGQFYILPGMEAQVMANYTRMLYRPGGSVSGAAPIVDLRAGGNLNLNGSISDGYFVFGDPSLVSNAALPSFAFQRLGDPGDTGVYWYDYSDIALFEGTGYYYSGGASSTTALYSSAANSAASTPSTDLVNSAEIFPIAMSSSGYRLVAGADLGSVNPMGVNRSSTGAITITAYRTVTANASSGGFNLLFDVGPYDFYQTFSQANFPDNSVFVPINQLSQNLGDSTEVYFTVLDGFYPHVVAGLQAYFAAATAPGTDTTLDNLIATYGKPSWDGSGLDGAVAVVQYIIGTYVQSGLIQDIPTYFTQNGVPSPFGSAGGGGGTVSLHTVVRTGTGNIAMASAGDTNLYNPATDDVTEGAASVYTTGTPVQFNGASLPDPVTGKTVTVSAAALNPTVAGAEYLAGGGNITLIAGGSIRSARKPGNTDYLTGYVENDVNIAVDPQNFTDGLGALGGGNINVSADGDIVDLRTVSAGGARATTASGTGGQALVVFGSGDVNVAAGGDMRGGVVDVWSGEGHISAGGDVASAGHIANETSTPNPVNFTTAPIDDLLRLREFDAVIDVTAGGDMTVQGVGAMAPHTGVDIFTPAVGWANFYSAGAGVNLLAGGNVAVMNEGDNLIENTFLPGPLMNNVAVYPGSFSAAAISGDLDLVGGTRTGNSGANKPILMFPSAKGQLTLLAGGDIAGTQIAMLDNDLDLMPGYFTSFSAGNSGIGSGLFYSIPAVLSDTSQSVRAQYHSANLLDRDDTPIRIAAGGDIGSDDMGLSLWLPKQARISAGNDIINMMFFGQNLNADDITRIAAGRDITATTKVVTPFLQAQSDPGTPEPALQGNLFVLGGPGNLMVEAGRNLGPFLNSADISYGVDVSTTLGEKLINVTQTEPGGILTVGNEWNPLLGGQGAGISVMFGVAHGADYDALRDTYLDPANLANLSDALFEQVSINENSSTASVSGKVADRTKPIYAPILIQWMQANEADKLIAAYGTTKVDQAQAYAVFAALPELTQRLLLNQVYFNELKQASIPTSQSYQQYARGYTAVNILFPAQAGYTQNDLTGQSNGAADLVHTGDLDLRLATIQTARGGDIDIFGPGGRVLAGSTVATSAQAARRTYDGVRMIGGDLQGANDASPRAISDIPQGYEGILTLRGGAISTFTDGDVLINQSRLYTRQGGDIIMWSSNGDLNAGQGPKTTADVPPVIVKIDSDLFIEDDEAASTSGAGIAAYAPTDDAIAKPDVYLLAPRGTVDAGDAGVRVAGNIFVGALHVANADNFQVQGLSFGIPTTQAVDVGANLQASAAAATSVQTMVQSLEGTRKPKPVVIDVDILGFGGTFDHPEECVDAQSDSCKNSRK